MRKQESGFAILLNGWMVKWLNSRMVGLFDCQMAKLPDCLTVWRGSTSKVEEFLTEKSLDVTIVFDARTDFVSGEIVS